MEEVYGLLEHRPELVGLRVLMEHCGLDHFHQAFLDYGVEFDYDVFLMDEDDCAELAFPFQQLQRMRRTMLLLFGVPASA